MKEIRLNDKMWFGKYKNLTMKDILHKDKYFLDNLVSIGKIKYSDNIKKYLEGDYDERKSKPSWGDASFRYGRNPYDTTSLFSSAEVHQDSGWDGQPPDTLQSSDSEWSDETQSQSRNLGEIGTATRALCGDAILADPPVIGRPINQTEVRFVSRRDTNMDISRILFREMSKIYIDNNISARVGFLEGVVGRLMNKVRNNAAIDLLTNDYIFSLRFRDLEELRADFYNANSIILQINGEGIQATFNLDE